MICSPTPPARQSGRPLAWFACALLMMPIGAALAPAAAAAPVPLAQAEQVAFFDDFETGTIDIDKWVTPTAWGVDSARLRPWADPGLPINDSTRFHLSDTPVPGPGRYANGSRSAIETTWIDITEANSAARLSLTHRFDIDPTEDGALVLVRTEDQGWTVLTPTTGYPTANGFAGFTPAFESVGFDLSAYGGARIKLALQLLAGDNGVTGDGWQVESLTVSFTASVPRPDLAISDVAIYNSLGSRIVSGTAGDVLDLRANITNQGSSSTTLMLPVVFFDGAASSGRPIGQTTLPPVSPGASASVSVPAVLPSGSHLITAVVDPAGVIAELSRANNVAVASVVLAPPAGADLVVLDVGYELGGVRTNGARPLQAITANITVANLGSTAVGSAFTAGVYLEDGANVTAVEERSSLGGLAPDERRTMLIPFTANAGNLSLLAAVDRAGVVTEASEANNQLRTLFPVTADPPVDLTVESVVALERGVSASEATENDLVVVDAVVKNRGSGPLDGPFAVGFYQGDPDAGGPLLFTRSVTGGLGANATIEVHGTWSAQVGQRTLYARADVLGEIFEASELNNKAMTSIHVSADTRPNLVVEAVHFKVLGAEVNATQIGAPVSIEVVVRNLGSNSTIAGSVASASANPWVDPALASIEKVALPTQIPKNAQAVVTFTWVAVAGVRVFFLAADVDRSTTETSEFDNVLVRTLQVSPDSPDLVVGSVSVKSKGVETSTLFPGLNVTIAAEVTNAGVASAGSFDIEVWAGEPGELGSVKLLTQTVEGPFGPGESSQVKAVWLASFPTGGGKVLVVVADPRGEVIEAERDNNQAAKDVAYSIARLPNLVVESLTASVGGVQVADAKEGAALLITVAVKNDSPAPYLGGGILEIRDEGTVLFTATLPRIEPGASLTYETNWTARAGAHVVVTLDSQSQVPESDESDNQQGLSVTVAAAPRTPVALYAGAGVAAAVGLIAVVMLVRRRRAGPEEESVAPAEPLDVIAANPTAMAPSLDEPAPATEADTTDTAYETPAATSEAEAYAVPSAAGAEAAGSPPAEPESAAATATVALTNCPSCGAPVEPGWIMCPACEAPLPQP